MTRPRRRSLIGAVIVFAASPILLLPHAGARSAKQLVEFTPVSTAALSMLEVEITGLGAEPRTRQPVSDAALFVTKPGGDAAAALTAAENTSEKDGTQFNVRLLIVANGRLYTGGRGQCGGWESDVARCASVCDGGSFAVRRKGAAPLELLVGAIPGGAAGQGAGVTVSPCGLEDDLEARLVVKTGRGLAVAGFGSD
jgi:hypothetical protein